MAAESQTTETPEDQAFRELGEGYAAYGCGAACQYPENSPSWRRWRMGWKEAEAGLSAP